MEGWSALGVVLRGGSVAVCTQVHERKYRHREKKSRKQKENLREGHGTADGRTLRNI